MFDAAAPLVQVDGLKMYFPIYSGILRRHTGDVEAVDGVSFDIMPRLWGWSADPAAANPPWAGHCCGFMNRQPGLW